MELKFIRNKSTLEITRSTEQPLLFGQQHPHLNNGVIKPDYEYLNQNEINSIILGELKELKIIELKKNRDSSNSNPAYVQGLEVIMNEDGSFTTTGNLKQFIFKTNHTGISTTSPESILNHVLRGNVIRYSCTIIEEGSQRKGYVEIDSGVALSIETYLAIRSQNNISFTNQQEALINACTTKEEIDLIDITIN